MSYVLPFAQDKSGREASALVRGCAAGKCWSLDLIRKPVSWGRIPLHAAPGQSAVETGSLAVGRVEAYGGDRVDIVQGVVCLEHGVGKRNREAGEGDCHMVRSLSARPRSWELNF